MWWDPAWLTGLQQDAPECPGLTSGEGLRWYFIAGLPRVQGTVLH